MTTTKTIARDIGFATTAGMPGLFTSTFDFQFALTMGAAPYDGAAVGECFETARRIEDNDIESWTQAWEDTGRRVEEIARTSLAGGHRISAREAFMRASNYWRTSGFFLHESDPRCLGTWERQRDCFREGAALLDAPVEAVTIPYEDGTTLPGYFLKVDDTDTPRPTLLCLGGGDTTSEELYFFGNGAAAVRRGYNALVFEIPGQRGATYENPQLFYRHDAEVPMRYVCDWVLARPDVDPERLALIGHSFGGYFAPRAVMFEKRIKACIASTTYPALLPIFLPRFGLAPDEPWPRDLEERLDRSSSLVRFMVESDFRWRMGTGDGTIADFLDACRPYDLWGMEDLITCPYFNIGGQAEGRVMEEGHRFFEKLTCPKAEHIISEAEGGEAHCGVNNPSLKHQIEFDWLDGVFGVGG